MQTLYKCKARLVLVLAGRVRVVDKRRRQCANYVHICVQELHFYLFIHLFLAHESCITLIRWCCRVEAEGGVSPPSQCFHSQSQSKHKHTPRVLTPLLTDF